MVLGMTRSRVSYRKRFVMESYHRQPPTLDNLFLF